MTFGIERMIATGVVALALSLPLMGNVAYAEDETPLHIIDVNGPLVEPFHSTGKKAGEDAATALGVNYEYLSPTSVNNLTQDMVRLLEVAISRRPDAIIIGNFFPESLNPVIRSAVEAGIPVVQVNSGEDDWKDVGAIAYVGQDEKLAGVEAGRAMLAAGVKHGLCVNHVPGHPAAESRCNGFTEAMQAGGAKATVLTMPQADASNPQQISQSIRGTLTADKTIDGIFPLSSFIAEVALQTVAESGFADRVTIGSTDLSLGTLKAVKEGTLLFVIDQQPYLQNYYGVLIATQWLRYGLKPIGAIRTGPLMITKDNVDKVLETANLGVRGPG